MDTQTPIELAKYPELIPVLGDDTWLHRWSEKTGPLWYLIKTKLAIFYQGKAWFTYALRPEISPLEVIAFLAVFLPACMLLVKLWLILHAFLPFMILSPVEDAVCILIAYKMVQWMNIRWSQILRNS